MIEETTYQLVKQSNYSTIEEKTQEDDFVLTYLELPTQNHLVTIFSFTNTVSDSPNRWDSLFFQPRYSFKTPPATYLARSVASSSTEMLCRSKKLSLEVIIVWPNENNLCSLQKTLSPLWIYEIHRMMESCTWLKKIPFGRGPHPTSSLRKTMFSTQRSPQKTMCVIVCVHCTSWMVPNSPSPQISLTGFLWFEKKLQGFSILCQSTNGIVRVDETTIIRKDWGCEIASEDVFASDIFGDAAKTIPIALWRLGLDFGWWTKQVWNRAVVVKQQNVWIYSWKFCWNPLPWILPKN